MYVLYVLIEEHNYCISNRGNVFQINDDSTLTRKFTSIQNGYIFVILNGKSYSVHRLVGKYFIPNPQNKCCINHKNGIKHDNRVENLEWMTQKENVQHAQRIGLFSKPYQANTQSTVFTTTQLEKIRKEYQPATQKELAKKYKVSTGTISRIINGVVTRGIDEI